MTVESLDNQLRELVIFIAGHLNLPAIAEVVLPEHMLSSSESDAKHDKFGLVVLEDGNAGFFYRLLNVQPERIEDYRAMAISATGLPITSMLDNLNSNDLFERALGFGVINAATAATFQRTGFMPPEKVQNSSSEARRIGMIGYFREQARQLVASGNTVCVLEINEKIVDEVHQHQPAGISASTNPASLSQCDVIFCTASTLINGTLDSLLDSLDNNIPIELVGPSAGCFPDPLFKRGISDIGGSLVTDIDTVIDRIRSGQPWRDSVRKYTLTKDSYPGIKKLISA